MAHEVRLSTLDYLDATSVAVDRMRSSVQHGLRHANVRRRTLPTRLHNDILGCCSELAVARWLDLPWPKPLGIFTAEADVGEDVDVRATERDDGHFILRQQDHAYRTFVLVTGTPPIMLLQGYIRGTDAMTPEWWRDPHGYGGAWFLPQSALNPITADGVVPACLRQRADVSTAVPAR